MLDYIEYDSEFALIGLPSVAMERFPKSEGWNRTTIQQMVYLVDRGFSEMRTMILDEVDDTLDDCGTLIAAKRAVDGMREE